MKSQMTAPNKQPILSHLEELRWVFIRSIIYIALASVASFFFADVFLDILKMPAKEAVSGFFILKPTDSVVIYFKTILYGAFVMAFIPVICELLSFIRPALEKEQALFVFKWTIASVFLFAAGTVFIYFAVLPVSLKFLMTLAGMLTASATQISFNSYVSFVIALLLCGGIVFQIPLVCAVLTMLNIITPFTLKRFRKEIFFGLCVFSAVVTPTTDVFSMLLFVGPMIVLYELGVIISSAIYKRKASETDKIYDGSKYD